LWFYAKSDHSDPLEREDIPGLLATPDKGWTREQIQNTMTTTNMKKNNGLGYKTMALLSERFGSIEQNISRLAKVTSCVDGTTKLLLDLVKDQLQIETVIIPWDDRQKSTLCLSSQVGCRQACTFCATGRMGKLRSLTADEILSQMYWASKTCRILGIYPIENVVFMGLGEPADNVEAVTRAAQNLIHPHIFQLAPRKVTISTVAPTPEAFEELGKSEVVLAWSVHASEDTLRKQLVPTTQYSMAELRSGLIRTLQERRKRLRNTMLEVTLLDDINDSKENALHLAEFCRPLLDEVDGIKLVVNLIPWNDIAATSGPAAAYRKPSMDRVLEFQKVLVDHGIMCYVRTTRGDEENAACGMLATKKSTRTPT
jgi:23S rRNA (adenine2503-C2)-methyltransferase